MHYSLIIEGSPNNGTFQWINPYKFKNPFITSMSVLFKPTQGQAMFNNVDQVNVANQMKAIEAKVNETNKQNAQILAGSSGQEVNPIKVEAKVEPMVGTSASEFVKSVNKANNELIKQEQMVNEYHASYTTDDKERKLFEDINNELQRMRSVRYVHGPSAVPNTNGRRLGLDRDDLMRGRYHTRYGIEEDDFFDNRPRGPQPGLQAIFARRAEALAHPPAETVQEPVGNVQRGARRRTFGPPTPIQFDGSHVIVDNARLHEMREHVKRVTKAAPLSYDQYKEYLRRLNLYEYFDENGECEYFYHRFQILSNEFPENIRISNEISPGIPEGFDDNMKNTINVAISLYLFKPVISASKEPLYECRNNFLTLLALLNENEYLTEEYELYERDIFIDVVRIGKLMEEYEKGTKSPVHSFFVKLSKSEFVKWEIESLNELFNTFDEIDDYIKQFEQIEDNQGTERYREFLHSIALTALSLFGPDEHSSQYQFDDRWEDEHAGWSRSDQSLSDQSPSDGMDSSAQSQYYHDYVEAWEDDD